MNRTLGKSNSRRSRLNTLDMQTKLVTQAASSKIFTYGTEIEEFARQLAGTLSNEMVAELFEIAARLQKLGKAPDVESYD